jgi:hypothetical protein
LISLLHVFNYRTREIALEKAEQLKKENKPAEARKQLERTLKVTEDMIHHTIKVMFILVYI